MIKNLISVFSFYGKWLKWKLGGSAISLTSYKKKQQEKSEREIQGKLINLNKQYILNPSDSLNKDMEKTDGTKNLEREKGKWYYHKGKGKMASRRGKKYLLFL